MLWLWSQDARGEDQGMTKYMTVSMPVQNTENLNISLLFLVSFAINIMLGVSYARFEHIKKWAGGNVRVCQSVICQD